MAPQISIEIEDLQELARINPLAWEQLLHIADSRILQARIDVLENGNAGGDSRANHQARDHHK